MKLMDILSAVKKAPPALKARATLYIPYVVKLIGDHILVGSGAMTAQQFQNLWGVPFSELDERWEKLQSILHSASTDAAAVREMCDWLDILVAKHNERK